MKLHPLNTTRAFGYTTFGCMWKKGELLAGTSVRCTRNDGTGVPMDTRITAYWPDGTVKWSAHTADAALLGDEFEVSIGEPLAVGEGLRINREGDSFEIESGMINVSIPKDGKFLFTKATRNGVSFVENARPKLLLEQPVEVNGLKGNVTKELFGRIDKVSIEHEGKLTVTVRYDGTHVASDGQECCPFIIRMELGYNNPNLKFTHTFLYDGDEDRDFMKGLGIVFEAPMEGKMYNRHVKFTGDYGVFHEMSAYAAAWRPRVSPELFKAQIAGKPIEPEGEELEAVNTVMEATPFWDEYSLTQDSVSHFGITKKQAGDDLCSLDCLHGNRTNGGASFGSMHGSITVAIRDFWEKYPSGINVKGLTSDRATCSIWFYAPEAKAFDFRHYARRGYNQVCYEGYDYKGATADGIANTNECSITFSEEMIPSDEFVKDFTNLVNNPPLFVGTPEFYHEMRAFGHWSLPSYETETERWLEKQLEKAFSFYQNEVEQRNWYGFFNYGDFMHTYDSTRHEWKYDVGGYAWDNTELVPTLWLWQYFLRTGREDVFRLAEKLSRHASEVDVYHMGKYKGLGSRHNVRHWGCPCKEARIAMAHHHRYYYYLTGDARLEDIFEELKDNELSFLNKDPLGDFFEKSEMKMPSHARSGPDWSSLCSNWMTRWERFNDTKYRDKILVGIEDIKKAPLRLFSGPDFEFDPKTCHLGYIGERTTGGMHLQICMGAPTVWTEMADLLERDDWNEMLAELGYFWFLPKEQRMEETGGLIGKRECTFPFMATAIGAYAALYRNDKDTAIRTWRALLETMLNGNEAKGFEVREVEDAGNHCKLKEIEWISTNFVSQFCLNTIIVLDYIRQYLPSSLEDAAALVGTDETHFHKA